MSLSADTSVLRMCSWPYMPRPSMPITLCYCKHWHYAVIMSV